jgi:hypothetical protein
MTTEARPRSGARKKAVLPRFTELDRTVVRDLGTMVKIELDQDTHDFSHLVGKKVVIDGKLEYCFSIERLAHPAPWKRGEQVHLLIRKSAVKRRNWVGSISAGGELPTSWSEPVV